VVRAACLGWKSLYPRPNHVKSRSFVVSVRDCFRFFNPRSLSGPVYRRSRGQSRSHTTPLRLREPMADTAGARRATDSKISARSLSTNTRPRVAGTLNNLGILDPSGIGWRMLAKNSRKRRGFISDLRSGTRRSSSPSWINSRVASEKLIDQICPDSQENYSCHVVALNTRNLNVCGSSKSSTHTG